MVDISHVMGSDLQIGPTGDLAIAEAAVWTEQRLLRRLLTNTGGYVWQLTYGGGLPAFIGSTVCSQQIAAVIRRQLALEGSVAAQPEPVISIQSDQNSGVFASIIYESSQTGASQTLLVPRTS